MQDSANARESIHLQAGAFANVIAIQKPLTAWRHK